MTTIQDIKVEFPKSQRDLFPAAAQQLYIEAYRQALVDSSNSNNAQLSIQGIAARDAWEAVKRAYIQDPVTHIWRAIGEAAPVQPKQRSLIDIVKGWFKIS